MKKLLAFITALSICVSLTACGNKKDDQDGKDNELTGDLSENESNDESDGEQAAEEIQADGDDVQDSDGDVRGTPFTEERYLESISSLVNMLEETRVQILAHIELMDINDGNTLDEWSTEFTNHIAFVRLYAGELVEFLDLVPADYEEFHQKLVAAVESFYEALENYNVVCQAMFNDEIGLDEFMEMSESSAEEFEVSDNLWEEVMNYAFEFFG